eukprot:3655807-Pyramimonas_sp.AAC.1
MLCKLCGASEPDTRCNICCVSYPVRAWAMRHKRCSAGQVAQAARSSRCRAAGCEAANAVWREPHMAQAEAAWLEPC